MVPPAAELPRPPPEGAAGPLGSGPALAPRRLTVPAAAELPRPPPEGAAGPLGSGPALAPRPRLAMPDLCNADRDKPCRMP